VQCIDLGLIDYKKAWDYQEALFKKIIDIKLANRECDESAGKSTPNYLIFCEHPHVYTLGKSGDMGNLLLDNDGLSKHQVSFYKINRGGDITYHGPGQIVGYPIIDLDNFVTDIHKYLRMLEEAVIRTLQKYGLDGGRIAGLTGVWIDHVQQKKPRKICAIGVKTSRWVTMHGFALNVQTDLHYFDHIIPCGIDDKAVTSISAELGYPVDIRVVEQSLKEDLKDIFQLHWKEEEVDLH
jgi:lipoyl(octanoyl) transferase